LILRDAEKLEDEERAFVEHLVEMSLEVAEAQLLAREFNNWCFGTAGERCNAKEAEKAP